MNIHKYIVSLAIQLIVLVNILAQSESEPYFFIQLTDPQFGMFENNENFERETILYEKAIVGINKLEPDFVVITGDYVHDQNSEAQIKEFKRLTSKINPDIPIYYSPGNHDVGMVPDKKSLKKYRKNYGKDRFVFPYNGSLFIGFNTSLIKGKLVSEESKQFKWLTKQIRKGKDFNNTIVFCHYPFFIKDVEEPTAYSNIDLEYRKKYLDLFAENGVDAVFTGHHHNNILNAYGEVQLVTTSSAGKPLGDAPSGMRVIKVYTDKIEHKYFGFDELPESVQFK